MRHLTRIATYRPLSLMAPFVVFHFVVYGDSDSEPEIENVQPGCSTQTETVPMNTAQPTFERIKNINPQLNKWKIKGRASRISRLFPIKENKRMFFFGLQDDSGTIKLLEEFDLICGPGTCRIFRENWLKLVPNVIDITGKQKISNKVAEGPV
ncbi:hypothetical protein OUZ56_003437 [Daphnia magna]|uniref:Uncharacterized protein n=1 Tax=Daphnia magna TaxID=35525 RepID=A0ABR0A8R8_9CRUS|nr:hypothetical protein OUZ56_003437 [Daphnia magna]